jgi:hypothetical protein
LVAAKQSLSFAPTAATNQHDISFGNEIGPIIYQRTVYSVDTRQRCSDLFVAVITPTKLAGGNENQLLNRITVVFRGGSESKIKLHV